MFISRRAIFLAFAGLGAAACSDRGLPSGPTLSPGVSGHLLTCAADVRAQTLSCAAPSTGNTTAKISADVVLGGQGIYVQLSSSNVSYNAGTQIFQADVTVQNLTTLTLGTPDGSTVTGVKVFFYSGPSVVSGTGTVMVANPDGVGTFTGTNQPYFLYNQILQAEQVSPAKTWQWSVPSSVVSFAFQVLVDAAQPPSGDLYVSTFWDGSLLHYDSHGQLLKTLLTLGYSEVGGVAVGPDCNLYVSRALVYGAGVVVYSGANDALLSLFATGDVGSGPGPITFGPDGSLYVEYPSGSSLGTVVRYDAKGQVLNTFPLSALPTGYMAISKGILYLGANFGASVGVLTLNVGTGAQGTFVTFSSGVPEGVTFDAGGNFYAVQEIETVSLTVSDVLKFTPQGSSVFVSPLPQLNGGLGRASDLAFGGDGNLYVLNFDGNAVLRYHGTNGSFDQAFAAIPLAGGLAGGPLYMAFKPLTCH